MKWLHTIVSGMMFSRTSSSMIVYGPIWSRGPNGFVWSTDRRLMILLCCLCSKWGSSTGRLPTIISTKQLRQSNMGLPLCFISYPGLWSWNLGWGGWPKDSCCPSNTHLIGGQCWSGMESPYDPDLSYQSRCQEEPSGGFDNNQHDPRCHREKQHHLHWEVGGDTQVDQPLFRGHPPLGEPGGGPWGSIGSPTDHPPVLLKYHSWTGGNCHTVGCIG